MKNSDTQLIHRVLNGDDTAFSELVKKYQKQVHALAWRKIGDFHIAEEITQDTFLRAYRKLRTLKKPQRFASWLYVIAANRCNTWLHKKQLRKQLLRNKGGGRPEKPSYSEYVVEENERISVQAQREVVKKLLAKLEESERTVMTLHYFAEMSCTEIGEFLGVSANTIKSRLRRAQQRLKREEPMIREALDNFQISPNLTENVMREVSRIKPAASSGGKPSAPWAVAASTLAVMLLMLGFGNHQYLARFQKPYSFDATSEMTVEIIDTPIVMNLESKIDVRTQIGSVNTLENDINPGKLLDDDRTTLSTETQAEETMKDYRRWELPKKAKARLGKGRVNHLTFTPDGTQLAVGTSIGVWIYDAETGAEITLYTENSGVYTENSGVDLVKRKSYINVSAFSADGHTLACGDFNGNITLWDLERRSLKSTFAGNGRPVKALMFIEEDTKLAYAIGWGGTRWGNDGTAGLWNLTDDTHKPIVAALHQTKEELHVAFSPDGQLLAAACASAYWGKRKEIPAIQLWDVNTEQLLFTVEKQTENIEALTFSSDGKVLASAEASDRIRLWDVESGTLLSTLKAPTSPKGLAFSPDSRLLATGGSEGIVQLWDIHTGSTSSALRRVWNTALARRPIRTFEGGTGNTTLNAIAFSPDGKKVVSANSDGTVRLWETDSGNQQFTLAQNPGGISALAFNGINLSKLYEPSGKSNHPKGANRTLTSIGLSNSQVFVSVWDIDTGDHISTDMIENRSEETTSKAALSSDATLLVTENKIGFNEYTVQLWDTHTKRLLCVLGDQEESGFECELVFSPDGKLVAASSRKDNTIQVWDVPNRKTRCRLEGHTTAVYSSAFSPDNKTIITSGWTHKDVKIRVWDTMTGAVLARSRCSRDSNMTGGSPKIYDRCCTCHVSRSRCSRICTG